MTPQEKQQFDALVQTVGRLSQTVATLNSNLTALMDVYYRTNFPSKVVFTKDVEISGNFMITGTLTLNNDVTIKDGKNFILGTTTGTKFGTSTSQKLAFFGKTPIPQQGAITAPATQTGVYVQADVQSIVTAVNAIRTYLTAFGFTA